MTDTPLWVFGYGSLMWNPGFAYEERVIATLPGYARSFCMRSIHHRGRPKNRVWCWRSIRTPAPNATGWRFPWRPRAATDTLAYLRERELISSAYLERELPIRWPMGAGRGAGLCRRPGHVQYCGGLPLEEQAGIIATAVGGRGPNTEYLYNTASIWPSSASRIPN
jgi:cation transport protein ChaC